MRNLEQPTNVTTSALYELPMAKKPTFQPMYVRLFNSPKYQFLSFLPCLLCLSLLGSETHQISATDLPKFYSAYGSLLKSSLSLTLRKRDKKKEKTRQEQALKRKKKMTELVVVDGPKRGAGRKKRQRQVKAVVKQAEAKKKFMERGEKRKVESM
jgi:hypothetical protein